MHDDAQHDYQRAAAAELPPNAIRPASEYFIAAAVVHDLYRLALAEEELLTSAILAAIADDLARRGERATLAQRRIEPRSDQLAL